MKRRPNKHKLFVFFNNTATTEIYTLSRHDALPICPPREPGQHGHRVGPVSLCRPHGVVAQPLGLQDEVELLPRGEPEDRKSTRLNSSHANISYAVFCLKNKRH